jgi:hypothetical protein
MNRSKFSARRFGPNGCRASVSQRDAFALQCKGCGRSKPASDFTKAGNGLSRKCTWCQQLDRHDVSAETLRTVVCAICDNVASDIDHDHCVGDILLRYDSSLGREKV